MEEPDAPARIWLGVAAAAAMEKSGTSAALTVSEIVALWLAPFPVAVIVTVVVPVVAVLLARKMTVTVQVGLHGLLVNWAVTPEGRPFVVNPTKALPLTIVAVIDEDGLVEPWTTVRLFGEGVESEKSKGG